MFGKIGNISCIACAIHCLAMPILIVVLPAIGSTFLFHSWFEYLFLGIGVLFSLLSLCWGYKYHRKLRVFSFLFAAVSFFFLAHQVEYELVFMLAGSTCLVTANVVNSRLCKSCSHCKEEDSCQHRHF